MKRILQALIEARNDIQLVINFSLDLGEFQRLIILYLYLFVMGTLT